MHREFLPAVSIHPARPDALDELERCLAKGAVMMKCLPNCHNINCNDRRFTRFWERMAEAKLPLLAHTGDEHTLPVVRPEFADPRILTLPLECGVTVIAAHCATKSGLFTPEYFQVRNMNAAEGELINEEHMLGRASVVLLGPETAEALFGHADGVTGETVRIEGQPFRVIGVLESRGGGAFGSEDDQAIVPFTTAQTRLIRRSTSDRVDIIFVQAVNGDLVTQAAEEITTILSTRHRNEIGLNDFTIFTQQDLLTTFASITGILTIFLGGIAGISLLVGGIGIMNIMLVSVTERTKEIGLRLAVGARRRDVLVQFLVEAMVMSLAGGIAGAALGIVTARALTAVLDWPTEISAMTVAAAATEGPTVAMGETLFKSPALGNNGKSCASCHPAGQGLDEIGAYDDPALKEMINFCIRDALESKMFELESQELDSMLLYLRTLPQK